LPSVVTGSLASADVCPPSLPDALPIYNQVAEVLAREHSQECLGRVREAVDDVFAILDLAPGHARPQLLLKSVVVVAGELVVDEPAQQNTAAQIGRASRRARVKVSVGAVSVEQRTIRAS